VLTVFCVVVTLASAAVLRQTPAAETTYAAGSPWLAAVQLSAGLLLCGAGLLWVLLRGPAPVGLTLQLLAVTWLAPLWAGWWDGPALVRSLAMLVAPFDVALLVGLAATYPGRRARTTAARALAVGTYAATAVLASGLVLIRDPLLDLYCWSNCTDNVFLLTPLPGLARALQIAGLAVAVLAGSAGAVLAVRRLQRRTGPAREAARLVLLPVSLASAANAGYALLLLLEPAENPSRRAFAAVFLTRGLTLTLLAAGGIGTVAREQRTRRRVRRLAQDLAAAPTPGTLQSVLRGLLADDGAEVVYRLSGGDYVDASGCPVPAPTTRSLAVTEIVRSGRPVAALLHDRAANMTDEVLQDIGSAARLAVDNERLRAELLAELHRLQRSRTRIVQVTDETRRQLERNLHDGAQQRLLALAFEVRRARTAVPDSSAAAEALDAAADEVRAALAELRELAQGIYPAVLEQAGLNAAVWGLTDQAPWPVEVRASAERFPHAAERAAYLVVAAALDSTIEDPGGVTVVVTSELGMLRVEVTGAAPKDAVALYDRIEAMGGRVVVEEQSVRADIPCE